MNKLVSKNPVQRFKEGRKIEKFETGGFTYNGKKYVGGGTKIVNWIGNLFSNSQNQQRVGMNGKPIVDTISQQNTNNKNSAPVAKSVQTIPSNKYAGSSVRDYSQQPKKTTDVVNKTPLVKTVTPVDNYYLKGFEKRKDEIAKLGGVRAVQKMLGFTAGNGLDGKWGQNTEEAYQKYLIANAAKTPSLEDTISATQNQPILSTPTINPSEYTFTESQLSGLGENPYYEPNPELRFNNFDRTQTRQWLRDNGFNPYSLTGAQRKALRMILNGQGTDEDKNLIGLTNGLSEILTNYKYLKQGGTMNILPSRNIVERFKNGKKIDFFQKGGVKRFKVSYKTRTGGDWLKKEFDTQEEVNSFRKRLSHVPVFKVDDMKGASRGSVVKADRTKGKDAATTAYDRQEAEKTNNGLNFKQAYAQARKSGNKYFSYKGKVYKSDLENGKDNMTEMQQLYGTHLGYSSDPKLQNKQSRAVREQYRKDTKATNTNRNANFKGETNSQANTRADKNFNRKLGISTLAPDFIDAVSPQTAIGNFMNMAGSAMTGEHFTPKIYQNGFNVPGYASDLAQGKYKDLAFRGLDAYLSLGAPGARVNMTPGGTNVTEGSVLLPNGTREFSKWHLRSLGPNATRPIEGVLRSSKGTTYYIDNGQFVKNLQIPAILSNPFIQQTQNLEK